MKLLFVMLLLSFCIGFIILLMDFIAGEPFQYDLLQALNPFSVMEAPEYVVISIFFFFIFLQMFQGYLKKKQQKNSQTQK